MQHVDYSLSFCGLLYTKGFPLFIEYMLDQVLLVLFANIENTRYELAGLFHLITIPYSCCPTSSLHVSDSVQIYAHYGRSYVFDVRVRYSFN